MPTVASFVEAYSQPRAATVAGFVAQDLIATAPFRVLFLIVIFCLGYVVSSDMAAVSSTQKLYAGTARRAT